jgi:poly-gamma-glutamate capsule biosynthesis protein CapA/YwtB (metallophosphatase superfamily)
MGVGRREFVRQAAAAAAALGARRLAAAPARLTVAAAGDCIITRGVRTLDDPDFRALVRLFQDADAGFANCEMTFHDLAGYPAPTGACGDLNLVADPAIAGDLAWSGINLMTVANNHGGDYGPDGLLATLATLRTAGIVAAGGGANLAQARAPRFRSTPHGRVALVGCTSTIRAGSEASPGHAEIRGRPGINPLHVRTVYTLPADRLNALRDTQAALDRAAGAPDRSAPGGDVRFLGTLFREGAQPAASVEAERADQEAIVAEVARARREADLVLVTIHAHESGRTRAEPAAFLPAFARACVDAGADAFFGHGPHVIRGVELYKDRPIFYSLGNFYFQAETIRQIPEEIYANCGITTTAPSDFFNKVMGRMFEEDVYWEALAPRLAFEGGRLVEATLYPVDLRRQEPPTRRGTPCLARGAIADRILARTAELSKPFGTAIDAAGGLGRIRLRQS